MDEWLGTLPNWLRWSLFLPVSLLFSFVCTLIVPLIRDDFLIIHNAVSTYAFLYASYTVVPKYKRTVVMILFILGTMLLFGLQAFLFHYGKLGEAIREDWLAYCGVLITYVIAFAVYKYAWEELNND